MKYFLCFFLLLQLVFSTYNLSYQDVFYASFYDKADSFCYVVRDANVFDKSTTVKCGEYSFVYFQSRPNTNLNAMYQQVYIKNVDLLPLIISELNIEIVFVDDFSQSIFLDKETLLDETAFDTDSNNIQKIIYGYSNKFAKHVYINGYKINIQIAIKDCLIVGCPMIYTGF